QFWFKGGLFVRGLRALQRWRQSNKKQRAKVDLSNRRVTSLANAELCEADLHNANLAGADLRNTNLQRANLCQANFSHANLLGAKLRDANLQGADLTNTMGLVAKQFAGTDISNATVPDELRKFEALEHVKELSDSAQKVFLTMLAGCVYCWLTLVTTSD